jgi:hypothetical protein
VCAAVLAAAAATGVGCRRGSAHPAADATPAPKTAAPDRLPEDPVAGAKATAQWRAHLAFEERERKLRYDRDRMKQHRAVLRFLVATRTRYDRAGSKAAVTAIHTRLPPAIEGMRQRIARIDHWGVSSNLLVDYDAMLKLLAEGYPAARIDALAGDPAPLAAAKADLDAREKRIRDWLEEAAETEDE